MRIADKMSFSQINSSISKNREELTELQNQAATQKRINKPSDDPMSSARVLAARTDEKIQSQFIKSLNTAKGFLELTDQSLGELTEALTRAKELSIGQANDASSNEESRRVVGAEVEQLLFQAIQVGNRKIGDRFIFGGHKTTTAPFDATGDYHGDDEDIKIQVNKDTFVAMNLPGSKLFIGEGLNADGVTRADIETPRTVEDLQKFKVEKNDQRQRKLEKTPPDQVYAIGRGLASVPTEEEIQDDQEVQRNDSTWRTRGVNIFKSLKDLETSLKANDKEGIQEAMDILDEAIAQVVLARSQVGSRVMAINSTMESTQKSIVDSKTAASALEDADVFQVVSDINKTESALKASLETSGKLVQSSLLDFLR